MTRRQKELFDFIRAFIAEHSGIAPSFEQMADALQTSRGNIHRLVESLEERGHIRRLHNRARAIEIVDRSSEYRGLLGDELANRLEIAARMTNITPTTALRECVRAYIGDAM